MERLSDVLKSAQRVRGEPGFAPDLSVLTPPALGRGKGRTGQTSLKPWLLCMAWLGDFPPIFSSAPETPMSERSVATRELPVSVKLSQDNPRE